MLMLMPDMLMHCIMTERGLQCFPSISKQSVSSRRYWKSRTPEQRAAFSAMRSEVQKKVEANKTEAEKKARSERFSKGMKRYWDTVDPERKKAHVEKMSKGMKDAWDEGDVNFGPRIANTENLKDLAIKLDVEDNLPRINDYSGVITSSQMAQLNG